MKDTNNLDSQSPEGDEISNNGNGTEKKKFNIDADKVDAFYGRTNHKDIFKQLLSGIQPINFREFIGLPDDEDLRQKHFFVAVIKHLLQTAKTKEWNLCKVYDYTYIYNGAYWKQCNKEDVRDFLGEAAIKMGMRDYDATPYEFKDKLLKQFLSDAHLPTPEPHTNKILINLHNGTFEFTKDGWQLRGFNPDDFCTYQLPFDYNPNAVCPLFDEYLLKVLPDESSRMVLQEFTGYIFTKLNLEKCLILLGSGGNGKSVFFNILNALIGKDNILNYSLGLFKEPYNRAQLTNVLLNYSSEKGFDLYPDTFKALVSGEPIQACLKYGNPFTLHNKVKFIINCNELPRETESTEAYFRRFLIVPFDVKITDEEKNISLSDGIIEEELPGVFNWLLVGLNRIIEQEKFTVCPKAENSLKEFRKQSDSVQLFIEENNHQPSTQYKHPLNALYIEYKIFCQEDGYRPLGKNKFSKRLENKGFVKTRKNDGYYFGIEKNVL